MPNEAAQLEQLLELLQQPSVTTSPFFQSNPPAGRGDASTGAPHTMPRPGMTVAPETESPQRRDRPAPVRPPTGDPFTMFPSTPSPAR